MASARFRTAGLVLVIIAGLLFIFGLLFILGWIDPLFTPRGLMKMQFATTPLFIAAGSFLVGGIVAFAGDWLIDLLFEGIGTVVDREERMLAIMEKQAGIESIDDASAPGP